MPSEPNDWETMLTNDYFADFLRWMVSEHDYELDEIIRIVNQPHKWRDEWQDYWTKKEAQDERTQNRI